MPKRHRKLTNNRNPPGHNQDPGSSIPPQQYRRALPALPGQAPQVGEAELLHCVTEAPAEPLTGAIPFGPSHIASKPLDFSLVPPEVDDRNSRARGMGHKPDGDSHPSSISINPLRTNELGIPSLSAPSPSGGIPIKRHSTLANSGIDPTTNGFEVLSVMEIDERQEGAKEQSTNSDTFNTSFINPLVSINNIMSHQPLFLDKSTLKNKNISLLSQ